MAVPPKPVPHCDNCRLVEQLAGSVSLSAMDLLALEYQLEQLPDFTRGWNPMEVQMALRNLQASLSRLKTKMGL